MRYVYISVPGDNKIAIFIMDSDSGKLTHQADFQCESSGPLALHPSQPVLYAALRGDPPQLGSLGIDPATGGLSALGSTPLKEGPAMISADRKGGFLMGAYYGGGAVSVHPINGEGVVGDPPAVEWLETAPRAHYIEADADNRIVLVPHVMPGNAVFQFRFDEDSGQLTPIEPHFQAEDGEGPRHICFHPNQRFVYSANENGSTVTAYSFDAAKGTLAALQTVSTLPPEGYVPGEENNSCAQIRIAPNGKFLYAPNRGHNSVACFRIDESGLLATIGYAPIERHTRGTAMDPGGKFLYTTGVRSGRLASFSISQQTGALEPLENFELGQGPMWVEIYTPGQ